MADTRHPAPPATSLGTLRAGQPWPDVPGRRTAPSWLPISLEAAVDALLDGLAPVPPVLVPLAEALGRVAAEMPPLASGLPTGHTASADGFALNSLDLAGASAYSPVPLAHVPAFVEAGDGIPAGCDCVLDRGLVEVATMPPQCLSEAAPGQGIRRAGEDMAAGRPVVIAGQRIAPIDLAVLRSARLVEVAVRMPRVRVIDVASPSGETSTSAWLVDSVRQAGMVTSVESVGRHAASIGAALDREPCDVVLLVGGTGRGRADHSPEALEMRQALIARGVALRPGETAAIGRLGATPIVALPGLAEHAFAGFLALALPLLRRLSGDKHMWRPVLPLGRKIASPPGIAEIVLLSREGQCWMPLATGSLSLDRMRLADAFLVVPSASEGHAAGVPVAALPLRGVL